MTTNMNNSNTIKSDSIQIQEGADKLEQKLFIALLGGVLLGTSWIAELLGAHVQVAQIPAAIGALVLVSPLINGAWDELKKGRPSSDSLASLAVLAALSASMYLAAGFLALFLWMANLILSRTAWGAQRAIRELIDLTPEEARRISIDDKSEESVLISNLEIGDVVRVRPGENLPADGIVVKGSSSINQASLTGEAVPIDTEKGKDVYAGTTNLTGQLDIRVTAIASDTTIGRVESLIREAEKAKTRKQELIEQLAGYYFWIVLMIAALVWFFTSKSEIEGIRTSAAVRSITVLVVTCPGALLISHPTAMVAAFAAAARLGIMIKQTSTLESAADIDTVVLDKTGTITTGIFKVSKLVPVTGIDGSTLLQSAAEAEQSSNHPLAKSIFETCQKAKIKPEKNEKYEEFSGRGVLSIVNGDEIHAGRAEWLAEKFPSQADLIMKTSQRVEGMSAVHVIRKNNYLGAVALEDALRETATEAIEELRGLGVRKISMFTGDQLAVAKRVGESAKVDSVEAQCLPEEKHEQLNYLLKKGHRALVVGDGINDGPMLASADVGVAMGLSGSDIATNSAGVALMNDELRHVPFLLTLARRTRTVITLNIAASLLLATVGLALAATGQINLWFTPFYYALGYIIVIANSLRLVRFGEDFSAQETARRQLQEERTFKPPRKTSFA